MHESVAQLLSASSLSLSPLSPLSPSMPMPIMSAATATAALLAERNRTLTTTSSSATSSSSSSSSSSSAATAATATAAATIRNTTANTANTTTSNASNTTSSNTSNSNTINSNNSNCSLMAMANPAESPLINDSEFPSLGVRAPPPSSSSATATTAATNNPAGTGTGIGSGAAATANANTATGLLPASVSAVLLGGSSASSHHTLTSSSCISSGSSQQFPTSTAVSLPTTSSLAALRSSSPSSPHNNSGTAVATNTININNNNNINNNININTSNNNSSTHTSIYTKDVYNVIQRPYANLMRGTSDTSSLSSNSVEFHIQNEDFPALPGANHLDNNNAHHQQQGNNSTDGSSILSTDSRYSEKSQLSETTTKTGIQTFPDGMVKNIPAGMLNDQFGMAGLLTFLRAIESDPAIVALALGHDLTTLGLNLKAPERNLYATFGGPWADYPCRTQDLDAKVPEEYLTNVAIREKLPNIKLNKLSEDVLFYLFYNCPGEVYQMAAACELYSRDWRFHKGLCVWLTRSQYGGVKEQTSSYEKGSYNVFDPVQWRKIPKDMTLEYKELEERPKLPQSLQQSSGQQAAQTGAANVAQNGS